MHYFQRLLIHPGYLVWVLLAYIPAIWRFSVPLTGDQKVYISTAMEMWVKGDWLRPLLFGQASYIKPPLQYWVTLMGWSSFGFNLFGTLLPSVLAVVLTAWFLNEISLNFDDRKNRNLAGILFAVAMGTITFGTTAQMEIFVVLFYSAAWWAALKFLMTRNWPWLYLALAVVGLSGLVKSPLYPVLWVLSFWVYLIILREWDLFKRPHFYLSLILGVFVGSIWYGYILQTDGEHFWTQFILHENVSKVGGNRSHAIKLWTSLASMCFPFLLFLVPAARNFYKRRAFTAMVGFLVSWMLIPALFFTIFPYRTGTYLYILVPALALMIDWGSRLSSGGDILYTVFSRLTSVLIAVAALVVALVLFRAEMVSPVLGFGFCLSGFLVAYFAWNRNLKGFALSSLLIVLTFRLCAISIGEFDIKGLRAVVEKHPDREIVFLDEARNVWHEVGLMSVALKKPALRYYSQADLIEALRYGALVILNADQYEKFGQNLRADIKGNLVVVSWKRWQRRVKFPYKDLIFYGKNHIDDWEQRVFRQFTILYLSDFRHKKVGLNPERNHLQLSPGFPLDK